MRFQATEDNVRVIGRTIFENGVRYLGYSACSISFTFRGKKASVKLISDTDAWDESLQARLAVYADEGETPVKRFLPDGKEGEYVLYEAEEEKVVTLTLEKYSEAAFARCGIVEIEIDTDDLLAPPSHKTRKMEIIGDSITCGYGVEAPNELTPFHTATENPEKSYSRLTAKALDAEAHLIAWSGNGLISHYVEETATEPRSEQLMPVLYPYTDLATAQFVYGEAAEKYPMWDFDSFVPDIICVNLGTNDASWCKDIPERRDAFCLAYQSFLGTIRKNNPGVPILCMLGTMDQRLCGEVEKAAALSNAAHGDSLVEFLHLPAQDPAVGFGADWHPCARTQQETADLVAAKIRRMLNW